MDTKTRSVKASGEPSVKRLNLRALTLAGPRRHKPVPDPLAVQLLENRLKIPQHEFPLEHVLFHLFLASLHNMERYIICIPLL